MSNATAVNDQRTLRIRQAMKETRDLIAREMRYSPDLRKQDYLASLNAHVAKLEGMLP